jgi:hypothetical protein
LAIFGRFLLAHYTHYLCWSSSWSCQISAILVIPPVGPAVHLVPGQAAIRSGISYFNCPLIIQHSYRKSPLLIGKLVNHLFLWANFHGYTKYPNRVIINRFSKAREVIQDIQVAAPGNVLDGLGAEVVNPDTFFYGVIWKCVLIVIGCPR